MRKLILGLAITLDGYIEGPNGEYDWCFTDQDYGLNEFYERIDTMFIGRKSYEVLLQHTENDSDDAIPDMPKLKEFVFSATLKSVKGDAVLVANDSISQAKNIKQLPGKDIWLFGGAALTDAFMKAGLVDELWLSVHPILLGGGKRLFADSLDRTALRLLESKTYETGLVSLKYQIEKA